MTLVETVGVLLVCLEIYRGLVHREPNRFCSFSSGLVPENDRGSFLVVLVLGVVVGGGHGDAEFLKFNRGRLRGLGVVAVVVVGIGLAILLLLVVSCPNEAATFLASSVAFISTVSCFGLFFSWNGHSNEDQDVGRERFRPLVECRGVLLVCIGLAMDVVEILLRLAVASVPKMTGPCEGQGEEEEGNDDDDDDDDDLHFGVGRCATVVVEPGGQGCSLFF